MINTPPYIKAIAILEEISTEGHSPFKVLGNDGGVYFTKNTRGRKPDYYILNEYICNFLLHFWNIPTPKIATIEVDKSLLEDRKFSTFHKTHYYDLPTFGSKKIENAFEMHKFFEIKNKRDYNRFTNSKDILKIGLFDMWIENTDRKPTNNNILFQNNKKNITIFALDHAFAFDSVSYDFLDNRYINNTWNENILATDFAKKVYLIIKKEISWINEVQDYFYFCIRECEQNFNRIVQYIPDSLGFNNEHKKYLENFLFSEKRNKLVFEEYLKRLEI